MTRTIEMETKFEGDDWKYVVRIEDGRIEIIQRGDEGPRNAYITIDLADFDRIVAEREKYARLSQQVQEAA